MSHPFLFNTQEPGEGYLASALYRGVNGILKTHRDRSKSGNGVATSAAYFVQTSVFSALGYVHEQNFLKFANAALHHSLFPPLPRIGKPQVETPVVF